MSSLIGAKRQRAALWPTGLFMAMALIALGIGLIYRAPGHSRQEIDRFRILFAPEELDGVVKLVLRNRLGQFTFEKSEEEGGWSLVAPRSLPAATSAIQKILEALKEIRIRKMFPEDPINISNFSLDAPVCVVTLKQLTGEELTLNLGLVNPIDNSTYIQIPEKKSIYHIDAMTNSIESMDINELVESKIFLHDLNDINSISFKNNAKDKKAKLKLEIKQGQWSDSDGKTYEKEEIQESLKPLFNLRAQAIIDQITPQAQSAIDKALALSTLVVEVEDGTGRMTTYTVSSLIHTPLPDVKVDVRQGYIVRADNRSYVYLINKDQSNLIKIPKPMPKGQLLKKLFY